MRSLAAIAATIAAAVGLASVPQDLTPAPRVRPAPPRQRYKQHRNSTRIFKPNGAQECARRRRQIARGQLTVSNGLVE